MAVGDKKKVLMEGTTAAQVGAVSRNGDTMTGNLVVEKNGYPTLTARDSGSGRYAAIRSENEKAVLVNGAADENNYTMLLMGTEKNALSSMLYLYRMLEGTGTGYNVFHSGSKPSGSYTGNGSAAQRTIPVGGTGIGVLIFSNNGGALVTKTSSVLWSQVRGVVGILYDEVHFTGSDLVLASENPNLNAGGVTYYYQVL